MEHMGWHTHAPLLLCTRRRLLGLAQCSGYLHEARGQGAHAAHGAVRACPSVSRHLLPPAPPRPVQRTAAAWRGGTWDGTCDVGGTFLTGRYMSAQQRSILAPTRLPHQSSLSPSPPSPRCLIPHSPVSSLAPAPLRPIVLGKGGRRSWSSRSSAVLPLTTTAAPSPRSSGPTSLDPQSSPPAPPSLPECAVA